MKQVMFAAILFIVSPLLGQVPPQVLAMNDLPNAGQLYLNYCLAGDKPCVTVRAICYGQCCAQYEADDMGYGCSGDVDGYIPPRYRYTGWSCRMFDSGRKLTGKADPKYSTKGCHNRR